MYNGLCYTSCGAIAGIKKSSKGSFIRTIPDRIAHTTAISCGARIRVRVKDRDRAGDGIWSEGEYPSINTVRRPGGHISCFYLSVLCNRRK